MLKTFKATLAAAVLLIANTVTAGTVWLPTDTDINASSLFSTSGVTFGIFDDSDIGLSSVLLTFQGGDIIEFSGTTITKTTGTPQTASLTGNQAFRLGAFLGGSWVTDSSYFQDTPTAFAIKFTPSVAPGAVTSSATLYLNDVTPVPEPSTLLLMALGVTGLMVMRRRVS